LPAAVICWKSPFFTTFLAQFALSGGVVMAALWLWISLLKKTYSSHGKLKMNINNAH